MPVGPLPRAASRSDRSFASSPSTIAPARCSRPTRNRRSARCRPCRTPASKGSCVASSARCFASKSRAGAVSLRLEMLQVARLAPRQLGESRDLVAAFLRASENPDGGFQNRAGVSDLYYTVFGLDGLVALQEELPVGRTAAYLNQFGDGAELDLVHLACLARAHAALRHPLTAEFCDRLFTRVESFRSDVGGYAAYRGAALGYESAGFIR